MFFFIIYYENVHTEKFKELYNEDKNAHHLDSVVNNLLYFL